MTPDEVIFLLRKLCRLEMTVAALSEQNKDLIEKLQQYEAAEEERASEAEAKKIALKEKRAIAREAREKAAGKTK